MAIVTLAGIPQTYRVVKDSLEFEDNVIGTPNRASFTIRQDIGQPNPSHSQTALVTNDDGDKMIEGRLMSTRQTFQGFGEDGQPFYHWACTVMDWEVLLQEKLLQRKYTTILFGDLIRDACLRSAPLVNADNVPDGPEVVTYYANHKYPAEIFKELCEFYGYFYKVDFDKNLIVDTGLNTPAAFTVSVGTHNYQGLEVSVDRRHLRNVIKVKGGMMASNKVTQTFTGDGIQGDFPLLHTPFSPNPEVLFSEDFNKSELDPKVWSESDISNPTPVPPHLSEHGYLYPEKSNQANRYPSLQMLGGPGSFGDVGAVTLKFFARQAERKLRASITVEDPGASFAVGFHQGSLDGVDLDKIVHGIWFKPDGTISIVESGVETPTGESYVSDGFTEYQVKIRLKASGATYFIQGGAFGNYGEPTWTELADTAGDITANLAIGILVADAVGQIRNVVLNDQAYNVQVKVNGVIQEVGIGNTDANAGVDCLIDARDKLLRFFGPDPGPSTIPPGPDHPFDPQPASTITIEYTYAIPIFNQVEEADSIAALNALDGNDGDGRVEGLVVDQSITSIEQARNRGLAELALYANPEVTVNWTMPPGTWTWANRPQAGQTISVSVGDANKTFLIKKVTWRSMGLDQYTLTVEAGARLRGLEDYIHSLIAAQRRFVQDNEQLDFFLVWSDEVTVTDDLQLKGEDITVADEVTVTDDLDTPPGPKPPYKWGDGAFDHIGMWDLAQWGSDPAFTRESVGYNGNGQQVKANRPRFGVGMVDKALLIDPPTVNLITATPMAGNLFDPGDTTGWSVSGDPSAVLSVVTDDANTATLLMPTGTRVYKLDNSLGVSVARATADGETGTTDPTSSSAWVRGVGQARVYVETATPPVFQVLGGAYVRMKDNGNTPSGINSKFTVEAAIGAVVYFALPQMEVREAATSPQIGERTAEYLAFDAPGNFGPGQGVVLMRVYVDQDMQTIGATERFLLSHNTSSGLNEILVSMVPGVTPIWKAQTSDGAGNVSSATWMGLLANGWHVFGIRWGVADLSLWIDAVKQATTPTPYVPDALDDSFYLGMAQA